MIALGALFQKSAVNVAKKIKFPARRQAHAIRSYGLQWTTRFSPYWYCQQTRWYNSHRRDVQSHRRNKTEW
jgi:hypothetical protein